MKRFLALFLTLVMLFTMSTSLTFAGTQKASATTMRIAAVDGSDVTVTNDKGKDSSAKADQKLLSGYTVKTGTASYCYISLDDSKAIKLDQNTKVTVEKSGKKIELNIKSGQIFFDVTEKLSGNESMNIKTSNITTGVRGTSGNVKVTNLGKTKNDEKQMTEINLLEGELEVRTASGSFVLDEGQKLTATGEQPNGIVSVTKADSGETEIIKLQMNDLEAFTIRATLEAANIEEGMEPEVAMEQPSEKLLENIIAGANGEIIENAEEINLPPMLQSAVAENPSAVRTEVSQADAVIAQEEKAAAAEESKAETALQAELASNEAAMTKAEKEQVEDVDQVFEAEAETTGGGGGSGSGNSGLPITGFNVVFDGKEHSITVPTECDNYYLWLYTQSIVNDLESRATEILNEYNALSTNEAKQSHISSKGQSSLNDVIARDGVSFGDCSRYDEYPGKYTVTSMSLLSEDVNDSSGKLYYIAIPKTGDPAEYKKGSIDFNITPYTLPIKWIKNTVGAASSEDAVQNATYELSELSNGFWPVQAAVDMTGISSTNLSTAILGLNSFQDKFNMATAYTTAPVSYSANTEYTVELLTTDLGSNDFAMPSTAPKYTFRTGDAPVNTTTSVAFAWNGTAWTRTADGTTTTTSESDMLADTENGGYESITINGGSDARISSGSLVIPTELAGRTVELSGIIYIDSGITFGAGGANTAVFNEGTLNLSNASSVYSDLSIPQGVTFTNHGELHTDDMTVSGVFHNDKAGSSSPVLSAQGSLTVNSGATVTNELGTMHLAYNPCTYAINNAGTFTHKGGNIFVERSTVKTVNNTGIYNVSGVAPYDNATYCKTATGASAVSGDEAIAKYIFGDTETTLDTSGDFAKMTAPFRGTILFAQSNASTGYYEVTFDIPAAVTATYRASESESGSTTWIKSVSGSGSDTEIGNSDALLSDITTYGGDYSKITIESDVASGVTLGRLTIPRTGSLSEVVFDGSSGITFTRISFVEGGSNELTLTNKCQNLKINNNLTLPDGVKFYNESYATLEVNSLTLNSGAKFIGSESTLNSNGQIILNQDSVFETTDAMVAYTGNDGYAINVSSGASYIQNGGELKIENTSAYAFAKNGTVTFSNSPSVWKLGVPSVAAGDPTFKDYVEYIFGTGSYSESGETKKVWDIASVSDTSIDAYTVLYLGTL